MFIQAFKYKRWTDVRTLQAVDCVNKAEFPESYAFVLQQLNHMVIVKELFQSRLRSLPPPHTSTNTAVVPVLEELERRLSASSNWYESHVSKLKNMERKISFIFADGKPGMMTVQEILFNIVNHGSYHRGNIA